MRHSLYGFSIVEVLTVLMVLTLLVGLLFAAAGPSREAARQQLCVSNLRQIGQAVSMYRADYGGSDPVEGVPMHYWQLGLPSLAMVATFVDDYIRDRRLLRCPNYHGDIPLDRLLSTYAWVPDDDRGVHGDSAFSQVVARRGVNVPVITDDQHNPPVDEMRAPRWANSRVIVLRLDGRVEKRDVPVRQGGLQW